MNALDDAIARLAAAQVRQDQIAALPGDKISPEMMIAMCENRDAILREVIVLGQAHLAQFAPL